MVASEVHMHVAAYTDGNSSNRAHAKLAPPKPARFVSESHARNSCPPDEENLAVASWGGSGTSCHAHGTYVGANEGAPDGPGVGCDVPQTADWQTSEWQSSAVEQENPISHGGQNAPPQSVSVGSAHGYYTRRSGGEGRGGNDGGLACLCPILFAIGTTHSSWHRSWDRNGSS